MIPRFLLVVGSLACTSSAFVPSTINITRSSTVSNLTSAHLRSSSHTSVAESNFRMQYCTKIESWSLPKLEPDDCLGVLDYFYLETYDESHRKSKEFRAPGAKKTTHSPPQRTPRKYTFRKAYPPMIMLSFHFFFCIHSTMESSWFHSVKVELFQKPPFAANILSLN